MQISLEKEFELAKGMIIFNKVVENITQYNKDLGIVDIPEFSKMPEDTITHQADLYLTRIIQEGRLDEVYNKLLNV